MLESPRCKSQQFHRRIFTSTGSGNLFTRIDNCGTHRQIKSSKAGRAARAFPHLTKNQSLDNSKENINYAGYLSKVKSAQKIDEQGKTSTYLLSLRKQFDKMAKNIHRHQREINTMNRDIQFMKQKSKNQTYIFSNVKERVEMKKKELVGIELKEETAKMETKVLENIISRMKTDQLINKKSMRSKEIIAKEKLKYLKDKEQEILQWDEAIHKTFLKSRQMKEEFVKNMDERSQKLNDFLEMVGDLQEHERFEIERKERTYELLSMESNDIMDAKNIVLRDVLMANKLLDKLLQGKINDLLNQYQDLQNSYHIIRNETNIIDPQSMSKKFFSYHEALEETTSTITFYEKRHEELIRRNEELRQIKKEKLNKILEEERNLGVQMSEFDLQKEQLSKEVLEKQLIMKKVSTWVSKYLKLFEQSQEGDAVYQIKNLCDYLTGEANKNSAEQLSEHKFQSFGVRLKKAVKEISIQDEKARRSEAQEAMQIQNKEFEYLQKERNKVKKTQFLIKNQTAKMKSILNQ